MTTTTQHRTLWDAVFFEPLQLAIDQPHQFLISSASVYLVAAEASILIDWPYNVGLAVGAEWAYLRGLTSGQAVQTRWAAALNWSAVLLVVLYGSLWALRKFGLIPDVPPWWGAILLTAIHILTIGAVTLCSAMVHRAAQIGERTALALAAEEQKQQAQADAEYKQDIQRQHDAMQLELERKWKEQQLAHASARARLELRASARANSAPAALGTPANTPANTGREHLREQIVRTIREQPKANRSELARRLGIGRTSLYELIDEAKRRGELG